MTSIAILTISFLAALFFKVTKTKSEKLYRTVLYSHLFFFFLTVVALVLLLNSYSFKGFLTDKMFAVLFLATGMLLFGLYRYRLKLLRAYFACFFSLPFLLLVGLIIPPLQFITTVAGIGMLVDGEHTRYPIDNKYQLQTSRIGVLSGGPTYSLIESKAVIFEKVTDDVVPHIGIPKSLQVEKVSSDSFRLRAITSEIEDYHFDTTITLKR